MLNFIKTYWIIPAAIILGLTIILGTVYYLSGNVCCVVGNCL